VIAALKKIPRPEGCAFRASVQWTLEACPGEIHYSQHHIRQRPMNKFDIQLTDVLMFFENVTYCDITA
jgi:hypothetical protein